MSEEIVIRLSGVNKRYMMGAEEVNALRDIDLVVHRGDFIAVMGPSGSGKSTLMNILGLLDTPDNGTYLLNGTEVSTLDDNERSRLRNRTIGFIFQNFNLLPRASALRNVMLPLSYRKVTESERIHSATTALEVIGLEKRIKHLPSQLSGGESQRVAIARALVGLPSVILADEPTGNLDSRTSQEIIQILSDLAEKGQTVIMVTHDSELGGHADRIIRMLDGSITMT